MAAPLSWTGRNPALRSTVAPPYSTSSSASAISAMPPSDDHDFSAFFECHIEQGPILDAGGISVGVVNAAQGFRWYDVALEGFAQHTGSTPMVGRRNALLGMARVVQAVDDIAHEHAPLGSRHRRQPDRGRTRLAQCHPRPASNSPSICAILQQRRLTAMDAALRQVCAEAAADIGLQLSLEQISYTAPVAFDERCVACREAALASSWASRTNTSRPAPVTMPVTWRSASPTTMLFAPCKDGISHHESESAEPEDLEAVGNALLHAVLGMAGVA